MATFLQIHPENPQTRLIQQVADGLEQGDIAVVPTDSGYALCCSLDNKDGVERIRRIRQLDKKHNFTLLCSDLSHLSNFAKVGNVAFRLMKTLIPGPFTFIFKGTKEVPRRLLQENKKTIGMRVPENKIIQDLISTMGHPLMSVSLIMPGSDDVETDPYDIQQQLDHAVDWVIDGGYCGFEATTVLDLTDDEHIELVRQGAGSVEGIL